VFGICPGWTFHQYQRIPEVVYGASFTRWKYMSLPFDYFRNSRRTGGVLAAP
jgi:hypothetical protein